MTDGYGRNIDYLRISLTDKCNLRCTYCMPKEGIKHLSHGDILSLEEVQRISSIMIALGIRKVRLTGGEPLVRKGVVQFVRMLSNNTNSKTISNSGEDPDIQSCAGTEDSPEIVMTTNGFRLPEMAATLKEAGLAGVNISLDTLKKDTFKKLTGSDELQSVLSGIDAAKEAGLKMKLNCVPVRGINDTEIEELVLFAEKTGADIRFIELMPLGCGALYEGIPSGEVLKKLEKRFGASRMDSGRNTGTGAVEDSGKGPAVYYRFANCSIRAGLISPLSHNFCGECNRIRLTAEGFLKLCLQHPDGLDLRELLRSGASDDEIKNEIVRVVKQKPSSHSFGKNDGDDERKMIQIGG